MSQFTDRGHLYFGVLLIFIAAYFVTMHVLAEPKTNRQRAKESPLRPRLRKVMPQSFVTILLSLQATDELVSEHFKPSWITAIWCVANVAFLALMVREWILVFSRDPSALETEV
jgi:protein-S-isoprenylcysteine O-methyltransferase Ste14